jgi:transcriptional regulator with XRE-family HTH domain
MTFGRYMQDRRDGRPMAHIARKVGVCRQTWERWEKGVGPSVASLPKIAEALGVPLAEVRQAWIEGGAE